MRLYHWRKTESTFAFSIFSVHLSYLSQVLSFTIYHLIDKVFIYISGKVTTPNSRKTDQSQSPHKRFILVPEALLRLRKQLKQKRLTRALNN